VETLRNYVGGRWHVASAGFSPLVNPATEAVVAQASTHGIDMAEVLSHARERGGPALRELTFAQRGGLLKEMSRVLREHREELLELSRVNNGSTQSDGAFDIDGATGTLAFYAHLSKSLGDRSFLVEGDGLQMARTEGFWGQHLMVPRYGAAIHVNAFNFPAWGFAEKAACAILAGMPVVTKPATATALVAARAVALILEAGAVPEGALQLLCGSTGDLLERLGSEDVLAFTGSADTALRLRSLPNLLAASTRVNVEADSLNAAVLAPETDDATLELFLKELTRELTQKAGQKCTAVRRILLPAHRSAALIEALASRLGAVGVGDPVDPTVGMGPLATANQLRDAESGVAELARESTVVSGSGRRVDGVGAPAGKGYFFGPTLLRADDPGTAQAVHQREVFGPVATVLEYDGSPAQAAELVRRGGGTLVTSVYGDDGAWMAQFLAGAGSSTGRLYWGSAGSAADAPGSGIAMPGSLHGGPGRAGGGEELGGIVGLRPYLQRVAVQGARGAVEALAGRVRPA
jgi:oxepin-CoA hydrolase/3-oxo-5,6-dehydrosuberyl-CoA semialdehyde dehydrogenase